MRFLKEDIDPKTNDTDDLYAVWIPYIGKRIVDKDTMIKYLEQEINNIKDNNPFTSGYYIGNGLAYRCIQRVYENSKGKPEPRVPNHSEDEFFKALRYDS